MTAEPRAEGVQQLKAEKANFSIRVSDVYKSLSRASARLPEKYWQQ